MKSGILFLEISILLEFFSFLLQPNFVSRNKSYLSGVLLPIAIKKFETTCSGKSELLCEMEKQLRGPPKPKPRNVYKTDVI